MIIDIGDISTRAILFDVVDGRYRFIASGKSATTSGIPFNNVGEGLRIVLSQLQELTGRNLIGPNGNPITPSRVDGSGVDKIAGILSAGPPIKTVIIGLMKDLSLESVKRLAVSAQCDVEAVIELNDLCQPEFHVDRILGIRPELIIMAGGTDDGASSSMVAMINLVSLACALLPQDQRPEMLYVGNRTLKEIVKSRLEYTANLHFGINIKPSNETDQVDALQVQITEISKNIRVNNIPGMEDLNVLSGDDLSLTSSAFGRIIRFLSKTHKSKKGALGINIENSAITIAAAFSGELSLGVYPGINLFQNPANTINQISLQKISRWLHFEITDEYLQEYIATKSLYPTSLPITDQDVAIDQAITREALRTAIHDAKFGFSKKAHYLDDNLLPWVEPIVVSGDAFTMSPSLAHTALMILDGIQPTGTTTLVLDQNHLSPALGAAAKQNQVLPVQILDSKAFLHMGTVIAPVSYERPGTPILRIRVTYDGGHETEVEIKQGELELIPLSYGQTARLHIQPLHLSDVGMGAPGRGGDLRVMGGALGVIVDARGRPLTLPKKLEKRTEAIENWLKTLQG
jgi:hypothetical protein